MVAVGDAAVGTASSSRYLPSGTFNSVPAEPRPPPRTPTVPARPTIGGATLKPYSRSPKYPSVPHVNMSFNSYTSTKVDGFQAGFSARQLIFMIWLTLAVDHHAA